MEYENFNGNKISKITLGTVQLGMNYGINNANGKPSEELANEILKTAIDGGITAFDTSSDYGTSEKVVGDYFKAKQNKPLIVTKFGVGNWEKHLSEKEIEQIIRTQVENSLLRLGYNKLPLLLSHNEKDLEKYQSTIIRVLKKLQSENLIEKAGASINHFSFVDKIIDAEIFEAIQLPLNMMDVKNANGNEIKKLADKKVAVFVRSVFLQGLFFKDPDTLIGGVLENAKEPLKKIRKIAEEENMSIAGLAISYVRDLNGVTSLVMGAEKPEQVKENVELINVRKISDNTREKITNLFLDIDQRILCPWLWNK
jgi:aryl-alcohol dehydrogenase-like predicted oxidoreductase